MTLTSTQKARWGLLATTLLLSAVLIGTALLNYLGALQASETLVKARASDLLLSARRSLRLAGTMDSEMLDDFMSENQERGLRYIGIISSSGEVLTSVGTVLGSLSDLPPGCECLGPEVKFETLAGSDTKRIVARLLPGAGGMGGHGFRGRGHQGLGAWNEWRDHRLVLEFEPIEAGTIMSRALANLLAGLLVSIFSLGALVYFWRVSIHADVIAAQLTKDSQLRLLGEMSAILGHELRNPLASLKGHAQLVLERLPPDHQDISDVQTIVREAQRLEDLTHQILSFARTGKLQFEIVDPVAMARAVIANLSHLGSTELVVHGRIPSWTLDRMRMEQVLTNLLNNAHQASPKGSTAELIVETDEIGLQFEVRDRGPGIQPGEEEKVFDPFYTGRVKGTGLGLTIARRIVEGHGGRIQAKNRLDGGAVFSVWLPKVPRED